MKPDIVSDAEPILLWKLYDYHDEMFSDDLINFYQVGTNHITMLNGQ